MAGTSKTPRDTPMILPEAWETLASEAGGVGRWLWNLSTGLCRLDRVSCEMLDLGDTASQIPIEDFFARVHPEDLAGVQAKADMARETSTKYAAQFRMTRLNGDVIWVKGTGRFARDANGDEVLLGTNVDITTLREAEETQALVAGEMAHRIGNLLSLTAGLFRMAARASDDMPSLEKNFLSRLRALSQVTRLSMETEANDVSARELVDIILHDTLAGEQLDATIDDIRLNGTSAQTITLALNELVTNAVKYGALREPEGRIALAITADKATDNFRLSWHETTPFEIPTPTKTTGFGMKVLNRMTATTFRGNPVFDWRPDGLHFHCDWSLKAMT